jgi:DNA repair exonuclease SbcCD nuclease subunit
MGDNVYPVNATNPTDDEINQMIGLFKRDAINELPVYGVRGNHDCYYDKNILLDLAKRDDQWTMPNFYYTKEVEIGSDGEKMGLLIIDSCLLLCSNYTYGPVNLYKD